MKKLKNEDLNKLESSQLQKRKDVMEKLYSKNAILPGDQEFVFAAGGKWIAISRWFESDVKALHARG
jgi:hypothetical protein